MFISYIAFGSALMVFPTTVTDVPTKKGDCLILKIVLAKNFVLSIIMIMFAIWNWFLAVKGQSVIEFM